jgi:exonuclease III
MNGKREESRVKGFKKKKLGNQMPPPSLRPPTPKKKKDSVIIDLSNPVATKGHKDPRTNNKRKKSERQHPKRSSTLKDPIAREHKGNNRNRGENAGSNGAYNFSSRREFPELPPNDEMARSVYTLPTKGVSNGSGSERVNNTVRPSNIGHLLQNPQGNHIRFGSYISALTSSGVVGTGVGINSGSSQVCDERNEFPLDRPNQGYSTHNIIDNYLTKTLCIWNLELHLVPDVWSRMRRVLRDSTYNGIIQIRRICQKNHRIRFEIDSKSETFDSFYRELKSRYIYKSCAWKVHMKDFTKGRKVAQMKAVTPELGAQAPLVLASYNVNSLVKKRLEVEEYIQENKVDILFLQETKKKADHWRTHLNGFNLIEKVMDASTVGAKGMALAVRNGITAFPVGESSPYFITLRLFGRDIIQPVIVICVYIPHGKAICRGKADYKAKGSVLKQLANNVNNCAAKFPQDAIVVGGDLNTISKSLGKFLRKTDMSLCEFTGNARTCTKGDNGLSIDHFIVSSEHKSLVTDVHVDTSLELSDHFPIRANLHLRRRVPDSDGFAKPPKWKVPRTRLVPENVVIDHNYW